MENVSKLMREVLSVDISLEECCLSEMTGYIGEQKVKENAKRYQNVKAYFYKVNFSDDTKVKSIYNDARFSINMLEPEHLAKAIKTINYYNHVEFFDELNSFYVKLRDGEVSRDQEEIVKQMLKIFFNNDIPIQGRITDMFLSDLLMELTVKYRYLNSLIEEIKIKIEEEKASPQTLHADAKLQSAPKKINIKTEGPNLVITKSPIDNSTKISSKTKALFNFIEYLHSNIDNFNRYDNIILELNKTHGKINQLGTHFTEVREKKVLQKEIDIMWDVVFDNIVNPIKDKVSELDVFDWRKPETLSNNHFHAVETLSKNFDDKDLGDILKAKTQYIEITNEISTNVINIEPLLFRYLNEVMSVVAEDFKVDGDSELLVIMDNAVSNRDCNPTDDIFTIKDEEEYDPIFEKINNAIHNNQSKNTEIENIYTRIKLFASIELLAFDYDENLKSTINEYKTDLRHFELLFKISDDFKILFLEDKIDTLKQIKNLLHYKLKGLNDFYNIEVYYLKYKKEIEKGGSMADTFNQFKDSLRIKTRFLDEAVDIIDNLLIETSNRDSKSSSSQISKKMKEVFKIDTERLSMYFQPSFLGRNKYLANYLTENLVKDLSVMKNGKQVGELALLIYESKQINKLKPKSFSEWYRIFCECTGYEKMTYKKRDLKNPSENFKKAFHYLVPTEHNK